MYVGKITLQSWKNFKQAQADLRPRVFIIGPNASGKSNFLDAFRFLRDVANEGLGPAVTVRRGGLSAIRCLSAWMRSEVAVEVELLGDEDEPLWSYRLEVKSESAGRHRPIVASEVVRDLASGGTVVERPDADDEADPERLTQTALEQINANRKFREVADFFKSISYQHLVPQVVRQPKEFSASPVSEDPFGRDLLVRIWNTQKRTRDAWLRRIATVVQAAVPQLESLEVEMDDQGTPHLVGRYHHWRPHPAKQNEAQLSDGTLRLFGLLWTLFEGNGPILLEEPELSLHPEIVRRIPELFVRLQQEMRRMRGGSFVRRQVLVSTHSPELLQSQGIAPEEMLILEPSSEGTIIREPDDEDRARMAQGLTPADVLLPKAAPKTAQMIFDFAR